MLQRVRTAEVTVTVEKKKGGERRALGPCIAKYTLISIYETEIHMENYNIKLNNVSFNNDCFDKIFCYNIMSLNR